MEKPWKMIEQIGTYFKSSLITVDRDSNCVSSGFIAHLEYYPMVNGRVHSIGRGETILNRNFKDTYDKFLTTMV